ncbi:endonuclease III [Candidatus Bathyarchaeota archaeon]|nr:endonuclease III [Candidatus Bathyarchaeota archaeon]
MQSEVERANKILNVLRENFALPKWVSSRSSDFETLIVTVISQNTADRNTARAFENLSKKFPITPEALSKAPLSEIEESLKVAGLYRNKARTIKRLAKIVMENFGGALNFIHELPFEEARRTLLELPGIGPKTADVLLLFRAKKPTIPIDTHIKRVSKRLGFAPKDADYEEIREKLQALYSPKDYFDVHILLIMLGRKYCKARKPNCKGCPINDLCPKYREA